MTRKTFKVMFFVGLFLLGSLFAGCGAFGGKDKLTTLQLQNENLKGRLESAERDRDRAEEDSRELEAELREARSDYDELKEASRPTAVPAQTGQVIEEISGKLLFVAGSDKVTAAGKRALDNVVSKIRAQYRGRRISVEGYPDSAPLVKTLSIWRTNMWLSANRARAVADYLMEKGITENLLSVVGHGASPAGGRKIAIVVQ